RFFRIDCLRSSAHRPFYTVNDCLPPSRRARMTADPLEPAIKLHDRAILYRDQRKYGRALTACRKSLRRFENALGTKHPDVANIVDTLGSIRENRGAYAEAERLYKRALAILKN